MKDHIEKKRLAILRILRDSGKSLSGKSITEKLLQLGYETSPRTIRFHLKSMDEEGLTRYSEKHGRYITALGIQELEAARVFEKTGYINALIDNMTWEMDFNLKNKTGNVIVNTCLIKKIDIERAVNLLLPAFDKKISMGSLLRLYDEGERIGSISIPEGCIGLGTVCSFTLNGIFIKEGIPMQSLFGGLLEIKNSIPERFLEIINYAGTSIDPLKIFLQSKMTDLKNLTQKDSGKIGANFFEIPAKARNQAVRIGERMEDIGLGNVLMIGLPEHPLLEIPITPGKVAGIALGGLNPLALLTENNIDIEINAVSGLAEFNSLFHYSALPAKIQLYK